MTKSRNQSAENQRNDIRRYPDGKDDQPRRPIPRRCTSFHPRTDEGVRPTSDKQFGSGTLDPIEWTWSN